MALAGTALIVDSCGPKKNCGSNRQHKQRNKRISGSTTFMR